MGPWRGTAEVQRDVRDETVAADCRLLDGALNGTIALWLTRWNHPNAATPRIRRDTSPPEDLDARARREAVIAQTSGLRPTRAHIERTYGGDWEVAGARSTVAEEQLSQCRPVTWIVGSPMLAFILVFGGVPALALVATASFCH